MQLTFDWLIESGFDSGEYLSLDISTDGGASWQNDVRRLSGNVDSEDVWHSESIDLLPYASSDVLVRYRSSVSGSSEDANVDNVRIVGVQANLGPNEHPVANAGGPYLTNEGSSISLNGTGSIDSDGSIVSYDWDLDQDGQFDDATGATVNFSTTQSGSYVVGLQVTDNRGATAETTAAVTVNNVAPTASAGGDQSGFLGSPVNLSAAGSFDAGDDITSYAWDLNDDGQYDDAFGIAAQFTAYSAGSFAVGVKVTDADGASSTDFATITVTAAPSDVVLFEDSFEVGSNSNDWNGKWAEDSQNDFFRSTQRATDGAYSAEVDGQANNATLTLTSPVDISGYAVSQLNFDWMIESGFDSGEYLSLDISTNGGASWNQDVLQLQGNVDAENTWRNESVDLMAYQSSDLLIRFRSSVSGSREDANVDNVRIIASSTGFRAFMASETPLNSQVVVSTEKRTSVRPTAPDKSVEIIGLAGSIETEGIDRFGIETTAIDDMFAKSAARAQVSLDSPFDSVFESDWWM